MGLVLLLLIPAAGAKDWSIETANSWVWFVWVSRVNGLGVFFVCCRKLVATINAAAYLDGSEVWDNVRFQFHIVFRIFIDSTK